MPDSPQDLRTSGFDSELKLKAIVISGIGLALLLVITAALMWPFVLGLRGLVEASDPPPPVLLEAREQPLPPGPRLQADPEGEMEQLRHAEDAVLSEYRWLDTQQTVARVPIERALEMVLDGGLPAAWAPPVPEEDAE